MIQFNLLPDVKINYLKARSFKRRILSISMMVMAASVGLVMFVLFVQLGQKRHITNLTNDISREKKAIESNENVNKILTIQNQLNALPGLHADKPITSRMFDYLFKLTPLDVNLQQAVVDVPATSLTLSGSTDTNTLETINRFVDTLKFATFTTANSQESKKIFSSVATTLNRSSESSSFQIVATYDPLILDAKESVTITVPQIISTRSETEKPTQLFQSEPDGGQQ
ncbi:MAG: hypothetical protein M3Q79_04300 [bacterium]|nr:hypothetical protein [bacterium]